jgi:hypothetical protein
MRHILTSVVLLVLLFPSLALGETYFDLVKREGLYYKKFTAVPFTGTVTGQYQGKIKNGKREGPWSWYWKKGQLWSKGTFKNGKEEGPWVGYWENGLLWTKGTWKNGLPEGPFVYYNEDGTMNEKYTGTYRNGEKVK